MKEMPKVPGLVLRGKSYFYRRRVLSDIAESYPHREIVIALGTCDYQAAVKLAHIKAVEVDELIDAHRSSQTSSVRRSRRER
jgi:hypothetical protein